MYLLVTVCLPLLFALLGFLAAAISCLYHLFQRDIKELETGYYQIRIRKFIAVLCGLGYSTIVVSILQMFGCASEDKHTGTHYLIAYLSSSSFILFLFFFSLSCSPLLPRESLFFDKNRYPWIACTHHHWDVYLVFAIFGLDLFLFEVIGLLLFLWTRLRVRDREYHQYSLLPLLSPLFISPFPLSAPSLCILVTLLKMRCVLRAFLPFLLSVPIPPLSNSSVTPLLFSL